MFGHFTTLCIKGLRYFPDEFRTLKKNMSLRKHRKLLPLSPIIVDNLIRFGGRIGQLYLPFEQKHQILLTKEYFLSSLLIFDKHERNCHIGREQTLSLLQESVWIIISTKGYTKLQFLQTTSYTPATNCE